MSQIMFELATQKCILHRCIKHFCNSLKYVHMQYAILRFAKKVAVFAIIIFDLLASRRDFHPQHPEWQLQMCGPTKLKQKLMGCSNQKNKTQLLVILLIIHVDGRCPQICWASRPFVRCANGTLCHLHAVAPESLPPDPPMQTCRCSVELISSS